MSSDATAIDTTNNTDVLEDDVNTMEEPSTANVSHTIYVESGNSKKALVLLAAGMNDVDGKPLIDLETSPWNKRGCENTVKPSRIQYQREVDRRTKSFAVARHPKTKGWSVTNCIKWLEDHPVTEEVDVSFIKAETKRFVDLMASMAEEEEEMVGGKAWRGNVPYLRLIHCVIEDDIKVKFLRRADSLSRLQLDSRSSESRCPTVFEMIAERWNSEELHPRSKVLSVHVNFCISHDLSQATVAAFMPATAKKAEDVLASMRTHLRRLITNWERSGQREGGDEDNSDSDIDPTTLASGASPIFGSLRDNRDSRALQSRGSFLREGMPSYLLYFWEIAEESQILTSALQRLNGDFSASDASSAPSATSSALRHCQSRRRDEEDDKGPVALAESIEALSKTQKLAIQNETRESERLFLRHRIGQLEDRVDEMEMKFAECSDINSRV